MTPDTVLLLEELPDGVVVVDGSGTVEIANRAFAELIGRQRGDLVGLKFESVVADEDVLSLLGFDAIFGAEIVRDNNVIFTGDDGAHRTLLVNSAKSPRLSRTLLTARARGAIQQELADTTRWAASEQDRADEIARARDALAATNAALCAAQTELQFAYAKLQSEEANRLKLEGELRLAQKLESIGQLAAGIAHEINTPTQYVGDSVQFLAESFEATQCLLVKYRDVVATMLALPGHEQLALELKEAEEAADLEFIDENAPGAFRRAADGIARIGAIVGAMKEFAHPDGREKCPADLNRAIQATLTIARNEYKHVAEVQTDFGDLPPVSCHLGDINQVILNLVVNAAHAISNAVGDSGNTGRITVRTRLDGNFARIEVVDTGTGIPDAIRDRIFDPFFTTKEVGIGSGQGLAISRSIVVDKHGGSLSFESEVGKGTTFALCLPLQGGGSECKEESP